MSKFWKVLVSAVLVLSLSACGQDDDGDDDGGEGSDDGRLRIVVMVA